ncbi:MAG: hypothetical protein HYZ75_05390 [Elusimicrobia bacterium]|nr:hypothetical protein [Elusimicrobiota bacterium]
MAKVDRLLATLRGETPPEEAPPMSAAPGEAAVPSAEFEALKAKLASIEERLAQGAPPAMEEAPPTEEVPPALPALPAPEAPQAPTELALFLHTRVELLEKKLDMAQQEALRSGMLLREREDAQRRAQGEVEELFRSIRESQRAAAYDKTLRESASSSAQRVKELEARLALAELRMVPAEDVLRAVHSEEARAELTRRLEAQLGAAAAPPEPPAAGERPLPPVSGPGLPADQLAVVLGRVGDLEARLEESQKAREKERAEAVRRETELVREMSFSASRFERSGGAQLLVEAALEAVIECVRQRDTLQLEMSRLVSALKDEPQGSEAAVEMRGRLAAAHKRMSELQAELDKQLALVQAWVKRQMGET